MTDLDQLNNEASRLQDQWVSSWRDAFCNDLLVVMVRICRILLKDLLSKNRLVLTSDVFEQKAQDAAVRLWDLMKRKAEGKEYRVASFKTRLYFEVKFQMYHPSVQIQAPDVDALQPSTGRGDPVALSHQDEWDELTREPEGKRIILILFRSAYFRRAILTIEKFKGRPWCYAHAHALHTVFTHTRRKK